jgi:hypothetical protein
MSRIPGRPRVLATTLVTTLVAASVSALAAAPATALSIGPTPVCGPTTCTQTYDFTGSLETFVVPANVSSLVATVAGGQGGGGIFAGGGAGGAASGALSVTVGDQFQVLAGGAGNTYGGGGTSGGGEGYGGGGSFIFTPSGTPLLAAGGGGGAGYGGWGGYGSGATTTAGNGQVNQFASGAPATGASQTSAGAAGNWEGWTYGAPGTGPAAGAAPGVGGGGGQFNGDVGGGGGGGYYGGGGGGIFEGGGGGSGYAAPSVTAVTSTDGANAGNGWASFTWQKELSTTTLSISPATEAGADTPVTLTATVAGAVGATTGSVDFLNGSTPIPGCTGQPLNASGIVACTTTLPAGADTVTASYLGDTTYAVSQSAGLPYTVYAPLQITTSSLPDPTFGSAYTSDLAGTGGKDPFTWTATAGLPAGLALSSSGVLSGTPTETGTFTVHIVLSDSLNLTETTSADLPITVDKAAQQVTLTSSAPTNPAVGDTYDVSATGGASNNPVTFTTGADGNCTIAGSTVTFVHVGTCTVLADQAGNGDYAAAPQQPQQIAVGQGAQAVNFLSVAPTNAVVGGTYDVSTSGGSSGQPVTLSATPASCTVDGNTVTFTHVGNCVITADQTGSTDYMPAPSATQSISVGQAAQAITFTSTAPSAAVKGDTYAVSATGGASGNDVTFSVDPASTSVCSISGSAVTFDHVGTCVVAAGQIGNADYLDAPQAQQSITVGQAAQAITFAPLPSTATVGDNQGLTAAGGASGNPVTFTVAAGTTGSACSISGTTLSFDHAGSCVVVADQGGNGDYTAAPEVSQTVTVGLASTSVSVALNPAATVFGQNATATATVAGGQAGSIQFSVDATNLGAPVTLNNGQATSPALGTLAPGAHRVTAVFTPLDATKYAASSATPQTLVIDQAATTATIAVRATSIAATIAPVSPGAGMPSGPVTFSVDGRPVGTATLVGGVATFSYSLPTSKADEVAVQYQGDSDFLASSATTTRHNPTITATLTSAHPKNASGWYRSPVTVRFTCTTNGAALVGACPSPVTLTRDGAAQSVSRTIMAVDGGAATVSVTGINLDQTRPTVAITGVGTRTPYLAAGPAGHCSARDGLSGIASCTISRRLSGSTEVYTATATDKAGNVSTTHLTALVSNFVIQGASFSNGMYLVHAGRTYTMLGAAATAPRYVDAMPYPKAPQGLDNAFIKTGPNRWALGVTFKTAMLPQRYWRIGMRVGSQTHVLTVQVVR